MQRPSFTSFAALLALVISLANAFNQTGRPAGCHRQRLHLSRPARQQRGAG